MTPTETLRAMLDERGVEWRGADRDVRTWFDVDGILWFVLEHSDGNLSANAVFLTPEQAIAATLGPGTCKIHDCEGSFSAVNRPVWRCDCGAFMTQYTDATTYHKPRFCPNCGRKMVDDG